MNTTGPTTTTHGELTTNTTIPHIIMSPGKKTMTIPGLNYNKIKTIHGVMTEVTGSATAVMKKWSITYPLQITQLKTKK
jgi:hypothetical protein